jgi:prefoldin subunit 5
VTKHSNKQTIEWHEGCLSNSKEYIQRESEEIQKAVARIESMKKSYEEQLQKLNQAKEMGLSEYDAERQLPKSKPKTVKFEITDKLSLDGEGGVTKRRMEKDK